MRAVRLITEPFEFMNYLKLESVKEVNCHGKLRLTGMIPAEKGQEYRLAASRETWVSIKAVSEAGEERCFFNGILTGMEIRREDQVRIMTIELRTGSFLLDLAEHTRSFQGSGFRYSDMIRICMDAADGLFIMPDRNKIAPGPLFLQYRETDWAFIKRVASHAGVAVIPEDATPGKKLYLGWRAHSVKEDPAPDSCRMEQDYEGYRKNTASGMRQLRASDFTGYHIRTREIYGLGESIRFEGQELVIGKVTSWLEGQELYHEYHLIHKNAGLLPVLYNQKAAGVSLTGTVQAVRTTEVKVKLQEDENQEKCRSCWFDYATVYSTPDGTGWYCMPEIGDEIRLVLPDRDENHAYAAGSIHVGRAGGRTNPDEKSWKNKQKKEIVFTPEAVIMRNNAGLLLELSDQKGIRICSDKDIFVQSEGDIRIQSKSAGIQMSAESQIRMQQGAAEIQMEDQINISGGKIYMN